MTNTFGITARAFRFYDDGTEAGASALANENTNYTTDIATKVQLVLRYGVQESGAGSASGATTDDYQLQYSKNGGAYTSITTSSTNIKAFASADLTDAGTTTSRLSAGTGSFVAGEISEAGLITDRQLTANNYSDYVYTIEVVPADVVATDYFDFRVLRNGGVFNTYSVTPRLTISNSAVFGITASKFRFYADGTENGASALANEDTNYTADIASTYQLVLRYGVQ